jgi:hypothetical protein
MLQISYVIFLHERILNGYEIAFLHLREDFEVRFTNNNPHILLKKKNVTICLPYKMDMFSLPNGCGGSNNIQCGSSLVAYNLYQMVGWRSTTDSQNKSTMDRHTPCTLTSRLLFVSIISNVSFVR